MKNLLTTKIFKDSLPAVFLPLIALFLQYSLESINNSREWLFFYPAIFVTAWYRGAKPGYVATALCGILAVFFLIPPAFSFKLISLASLLEIIIFSFMGFSTSFLMGKIHARHSSISAHSEELEKSTEYLTSLLENIPLMVFVKDAKDLKFIRFNKAGEDLLGFPRSVLIGKNDYDFFPKEQADFFIAKDRNVLEEKIVLDINAEVIQTKNYGTRILHTKKIPLYGPDGEPLYLLGVSEDITEKKKHEEEVMRMIKEEAALKERELITAKEIFLAKISTLLSASLDYQETLTLLADLSVTALGDWCTISIINDKGEFERATGAHIDKSQKALLDEYLQNYPPDKRVVSVTTDTSYYNPKIQDAQLRAIVKDERQYQLLIALGANSSMIVPIKARGKVRGSLAFMAGKNKPYFTAQDLALAEDLGRRAGIAIENALLYSSAQAAIRARDEFVSIASHELKTPITSLKMQLQMMQRGVNLEKGLTPSPEKLMKALTNSSNQVDRLTLLIEDLLDVTRIARGKLTYQFEEVNLSRLVKEVLERFSEEIQFAKCDLSEELEESVMVYCDRYRMEQVIVNLLSNAIKYGSNTPIHASVKTHDGEAVLTIQDHGMGIPKEMQSKIFERFERAISSTNISGLGLGLYISKQIIDAHQGVIKVESELHKGSTFEVSLPTGV